MSQREIIELVLGNPQLREFSFKFEVKSTQEVVDIDSIEIELMRLGWETQEKNMNQSPEGTFIELKLKKYYFNPCRE